MARPNFSTGNVIDPYEGLQNTVGGIADRYFKQAALEDQRRGEEAAKVESDRRWALQNARAEETLGMRRNEVQAKKATKDFLTGFDPNLYATENRSDAGAREFARLSGEDISGLDKVTIGADGVKRPATQEDIDNPNISTFPNFTEEMGSNLEGRFRGLAPTEEKVRDATYRNVLGSTGDPIIAGRLADNVSDRFESKEEAIAAEKFRVKEANSLRKDLRQQVLDVQKFKTKTAKGARVETGKIDQDTAYKAIKDMDLGWGLDLDTSKAFDLWKDAVTAGVDRNVALWALKDSVSRGRWGDNIPIDSAQFLKKAKELSSTVGAKAGTTLSPEAMATLTASPVQARTYEELQQYEAQKAWGEGRDTPTETTASSTRLPMYSGVPNEEQAKFVNPSSATALNEAKSDDLLNAVVTVESGGDPEAVSRVGAFGLTQVMPNTNEAAGYGIAPMKDVNDPQEQLRFGGEYLEAMQKKFGNNVDSLMAYNWGPGAVDKWIANGRNPTIWDKDTNPTGIPKETFDYVKKVTSALGGEDLVSRFIATTPKYRTDKRLGEALSRPLKASSQQVDKELLREFFSNNTKGGLTPNELMRSKELGKLEASQKYYDSGPGALRKVLGLD